MSRLAHGECWEKSPEIGVTITQAGSVAVGMASETEDEEAAHPLTGRVAEGVRCECEAWSCFVELCSLCPPFLGVSLTDPRAPLA